MPEAKVLDELYIQRVEKRDTLQKGQQPRTAAVSADGDDFRLFRQFVTTS